jgi:long-subunit fatty acid transport protein
MENPSKCCANSSQGSPISTSFADNTKEFENTTSVGIGLDYAINNRFSIRSGVNKYDMQYNTNDIVYYADLNPTKANSNLKTIDKDPKAASMVVEDKNTTSVSTTQSSAEALQTKNDGLLNQKLGYIEVPVELSYKLLDKKFGIELITGISTMFLNANQVSVVSQGKSTILGVANNLNTIHFSTNIGFGMSYNFMKSFQINIEPTLKYQLNTFSDNSGGFKPYIIGIYSGLSYRF